MASLSDSEGATYSSFFRDSTCSGVRVGYIVPVVDVARRCTSIGVAETPIAKTAVRAEMTVKLTILKFGLSYQLGSKY